MSVSSPGEHEETRPSGAEVVSLDEALYPLSPPGAPAELRIPSRDYKLRVVLTFVSLLVFLAIYLGLIVGSAYLIYFSLQGPFSPHTRGNNYGFLDLLFTFTSGMLFLFFAKGLFKRQKRDTSRLIEVTAKDQPKLFAFVQALCKEAKAPMPRAIYLSHEVNAAVFYPRSLLSLFLPVRKNLLVGLGLLNLLNVSELKAVLSHEFGHFAQSSMKLGQYVYVFNQAIADMVVSRDFWDTLLARWRSIDVRLSFPAWILTGLVWLLRRFLTLLFNMINIAGLSLSRQMEFNADLCAVSLTGSDALISGLWKTERGSIAMQKALVRLHSIGEHNKFTDDIFFHQSAELSRIDKLLDEQEEKTPYIQSLRHSYQYGRSVHFLEGKTGAPSMWATHPSNREREINAKRMYVAAEPAQKPAWLLLESKKKLRKKLTLAAYEELLRFSVRSKDCVAAAEIEALLDEDEGERKQAEHYFGFYGTRAIDLGDFAKLTASLEKRSPLPADELLALRKKALRWTGSRLKSFMKEYKRVHDDASLLAAILNLGKRAGKTFEFHGKTHRIGEARPMLSALSADIEAQEKKCKIADRILFKYYYHQSADRPEMREEWLKRYRFLIGVQEMILSLKEHEDALTVVVNMLTSGRDLSAEESQAILNTLRASHMRLSEMEKRCGGLLMPKMRNLEEGVNVASFVFPDGLMEEMPPDRADGAWINALMRQHAQVIGRLRKLHFKNLGVLLRLQEEIDPNLYRDADTVEPGTDADQADEGDNTKNDDKIASN